MSKQREAKLKKMRKYAEEREKNHSANMISKDYSKEIAKRYQETLDNIVKDIESFYSIYADKEKITISEAKKRASNLDVEAFSRKAKKYVESKDFSDKANEELRLYNMTMKVNRLELLKNNIILELINLSDEMDKHTNKILNEEALEEIKRQAGILGKIAWHDPEMVKQILDASFYNATFSERIWANQDVLKSLIEQQLTRGILQGINPRVMASKVRELFTSTQKEAERLMITESARVQTAIQKASFNKYGYEEYDFIAEPGACPVCGKIAKNGPYKVKDMTPGINASPMHPYCRCSVAASFEQDEQTKEELKKARQQKEKYELNKKPDKIGKKDIQLPKSVSAKARDIRVKNDTNVKLNPRDQEYAYTVKSGSVIKKVEVIAGNGVKRQIDDINRLIRDYPLGNGQLTKADDWQKVKGFAELLNISDGKSIGIQEIHWYQGKNIGKIEFKRKVR